MDGTNHWSTNQDIDGLAVCTWKPACIERPQRNKASGDNSIISRLHGSTNTNSWD